MQALCGGAALGERGAAPARLSSCRRAGASLQAAPAGRRGCSRSAALGARAEAAAAGATVEVAALGPDLWNKTYYPKAVDHVPTEKTWVLIDAAGLRLGRMATLAAVYLRGANKPTYTPSVDMGSYVVIINAERVGVTGRKRLQKKYVRHTTGRPGGIAVESFEALQQRIPTRIIEEAVWGMIPKEALGRALYTHLKVYKGGEHPHEAQQPVDITHLVAATCMP